MRRGPKPKPLLDRLITKIEIEGHPHLNLEIPKLKDSPDWPPAFHNSWNWVGAVQGGKNRVHYSWGYDKVGDAVLKDRVIYHKKRPAFSGGTPHKLLYEILIGPIPEGHILRYRSGFGFSQPMDVNPSHWHPRPTLKTLQPTLEEPEVSQQRDIDELADIIDGWGCPPWEVLVERLSDDYSELEIREALRRL